MEHHEPVRLSCESSPSWLDQIAVAAGAAADVAASLELARALGPRVPPPGRGQTRSRWELLAGLAAVDLTVARVIEPHLDALAILAEADRLGEHVDGMTWGVFASEGPAATVVARRVGPDEWRLDGVKPWCSLAGALSNALITAASTEGAALFAIDLRQPAVTVAPVEWIARGLPTVVSPPVELDGAEATMIGPPGWYLHRPGFWWGGIGVAACWFGAAVALARTAWAHTRDRPTPTALAQLGRIDVAVAAARSVLAQSAAEIDSPGREVDEARRAMRARAVVAAAVDTVLHESGQLLGPGPLAFDEAHARRVADITLYVRQHHGDRDLAELGRHLADGDRPPW